MTARDWHYASMDDLRTEIGQRVQAARLARGWSKEQAAREAGISSITWKRIEDGLGVQDHKRFAALRALGLNQMGEPADPEDSFEAEVLASNLSEATKRWVLERYATDAPGSVADKADSA